VKEEASGETKERFSYQHLHGLETEVSPECTGKKLALSVTVERRRKEGTPPRPVVLVN